MPTQARPATIKAAAQAPWQGSPCRRRGKTASERACSSPPRGSSGGALAAARAGKSEKTKPPSASAGELSSGTARRSPPPSPDGGQGRDSALRTSISLLTAPRTPWLPRKGSAVAPHFGRPPMLIRVLSLSLLAEERMRAPLPPCLSFSASPASLLFW
ncbi:hypothetical protein BS78_08G041600 [Paspalum vaginatum]|nr:hypothetical protein BS78_08G041600 [Paspalum vaginatum]